jgi:hypothetical protein
MPYGGMGEQAPAGSGRMQTSNLKRGKLSTVRKGKRMRKGRRSRRY